MKSVSRKLVAVVLALVSLCCTGGVYATWTYASGAPEPVLKELPVGIYVWTLGDNEGDMTIDETDLTNRFVTILNGTDTKPISGETGNFAQYNGLTPQQAFNKIIDARQDKGWGFYTINELGIDDPDPNAQYIKKLLGLEEHPGFSTVIHFDDSDVGYSLYTTRVDVNAKDENGNYVVTDQMVSDENYYIFPVNKTTFIEKGGQIFAENIYAGYSRVIWYYEELNQQSDEIGTFDVVLWGTGESADLANKKAIGFDEAKLSTAEKEFTVQNTNESITLWFAMELGDLNGWSGGAGSDVFMFKGNNCTITLYQSNGTTVINPSANNRYTLNGNTTYYFKVEYTAGDKAENISFVASRP